MILYGCEADLVRDWRGVGASGRAVALAGGVGGARAVRGAGVGGGVVARGGAGGGPGVLRGRARLCDDARVCGGGVCGALDGDCGGAAVAVAMAEMLQAQAAVAMVLLIMVQEEMVAKQVNPVSA